MPNTFDWIEIHTHDISRAAEFYRQLFGWDVQQQDQNDGHPYWIFDTGESPRVEHLRRGGIWLRPAGESRGVMVYVCVQSIDEALARVITLGGKVITTKTSQGESFRASFADPEGNVIGLWEG
ncbi:MAG TPA: VOC family protein [Anaerolineaceae bacterium]